ncbi:MAG TPA: papain-like cysteine protease family protein [Xanthobacteraceae bacterium]|nr:papain-like cysteine protease family protein [Xanthobacteraceae bacterium]
MSFPRFLGPATVLSLPPGTGAAAQLAVGGFAGGAQTLNFVIQQQIETNWCWAAVSTSVSLFYDPQSMWKQCGVAEKALSRNDCCSDPAAASDPGRCNSPWYLDKALIITGNLNRMESRRLAFNEVQAEIAAKKPIGCRVGWYGGGGHFLVIRGWIVGETGIEYLELSDPIFPQQPNSVRGFCIFLSKWRGLDA